MIAGMVFTETGISEAAAAIGDMANLKPIITVSREGTVEVVGIGTHIGPEAFGVCFVEKK